MSHVETQHSDDGLETVSDEAPDYPRWVEPGQRFDLKITAVGQGTNFDGDPCFRADGVLNALAVNFDKDGKKLTLAPGTDVRINAGQPILGRLLLRAERKYGDLVGRRLVITYKGLVKTSNSRTAKDFDVQVGNPVTYAELGVE